MKKIGVLLLALILILSLLACAEDSAGETSQSTSNENSAESMVTTEEEPAKTEKISENRVLKQHRQKKYSKIQKKQ